MICFRKIMDRLMAGPLGFLEDFLNSVIFEPLEDVGGIVMVLFILGYGVGLGMLMSFIVRMM